MSYVANQYNYATPLSSVASLVGEHSAVTDKKYFTLHDNTLDGSYYPISGDVGIWSSSLSNVNGVLSTPFVLTVTENTTFNAFRLIGSVYSYPVAFTVKFYNGTSLLYTITETNNSSVQYTHYMSSTLFVTHYEISVTKLSEIDMTVRLYNVHNPAYVKRADQVALNVVDEGHVSSLHQIRFVDRLNVITKEINHTGVSFTSVDSAALKVSPKLSEVLNTATCYDAFVVATNEHNKGVYNVARSSDVASVYATRRPQNLTKYFGTNDSLSVLLKDANPIFTNMIGGAVDTISIGCMDKGTFVQPTNVHTRMKEPFRRIYGKVYITYTDPMLDTTYAIDGEAAYNSVPDQLLDNNHATNKNFFNLYENNLTGTYVVSDENSQVGWVSSVVSNASGVFDEQVPFVRIDFAARLIVNLHIIFDDSRGAIPVDFTVKYITSDGSNFVYDFVDNTDATVIVEQRIANVVAVVVEVTKLSKACYPVVILDIPVMSTIEYVGYQDRSNLISIDLLEELTYEDDIEALGGVSANMVTVSLDNSTKEFYFNNADSAVAASLRRNRKVVPWLGTEVVKGEIEWYTLGTFWAYRWEVPVESLVAKVVAFDTIGLLDLTAFRTHTMQLNKSIGQLIEYVLDDAKQQLSFIEYDIDPSLYDVVIPYAWFDDASHTAALRKISKCYPMHIYCDRDGIICASPQKLRLDYYYDTWSDSTNVLSKRYDSLYSTLPNILNVEIKNPVEAPNETLVEDAFTFNVATLWSRTLNFNNPYVSDIVVTVDCDSTVQYTYSAYAWGIILNFTGTGVVRSIKCTGTALNTSYSSSITKRDDESIRINGAIKRDISSDFIQTVDLASTLITRLESLSEFDKYDVYVEYRGDIALSINDPILLLDGIAPDNRYNIKRHSLFWDGSLTGSAHLNT